jgi:hypothetical protein
MENVVIDRDARRTNSTLAWKRSTIATQPLPCSEAAQAPHWQGPPTPNKSSLWNPAALILQDSSLYPVSSGAEGRKAVLITYIWADIAGLAAQTSRRHGIGI